MLVGRYIYKAVVNGKEYRIEESKDSHGSRSTQHSIDGKLVDGIRPETGLLEFLHRWDDEVGSINDFLRIIKQGWEKRGRRKEGSAPDMIVGIRTWKATVNGTEYEIIQTLGEGGSKGCSLLVDGYPGGGTRNQSDWDYFAVSWHKDVSAINGCLNIREIWWEYDPYKA